MGATDMILTGFLGGALVGLLKIVTTDTSSVGIKGTAVFLNKIYLLSIRLWMPDFSNGQLVGETTHRRQPLLQPGNKPASKRFLLTVNKGVATSSTETAYRSSSIAQITTGCLVGPKPKGIPDYDRIAIGSLLKTGLRPYKK